MRTSSCFGLFIGGLNRKISGVLGFFGIELPLIHTCGAFGIAFSVFLVVIAALNLILDFEIIENDVNYGAT
jgi:uncharacterized YccA/Bax inhibitor family protein